MNHTRKLVFSPASAAKQSEKGPVQPSMTIKTLIPLNETINGLPVYGNVEGQKFTVKIIAHEKGFESPVYHVEIRAVTDSPTPQVVVSTVLSDHSTLFIQRIRHEGPGESPRESGFLPVILRQLQIIAKDTGRQFVSIMPGTEQLRDACVAHGFQGGEGNRPGHMRLKVAEF